MLEIKVIRKVEISTIPEEWIEEVVRKELLSQLPKGVVINKLEFVRKLNPTRMEIEVDAQFADEPVKDEPVKTEPVVTMVPETKAEEPTEEKEVTTKNIFANLGA